ncbi:MAG: ferritin-like domain-containing protein [Thermomicrobia bacterium]|nr:ferritin-like domain-containing protein [Thermomicrobia bacterium]MCA1724870.1 ferritin-like domain-containing protein [Thermomicrobia bacterium]
MATQYHAGLGVTSDDVQLLQAAAGSCESVQDIINIAATAEAFAVTALGGALENAANGKLALNAEQQQTVRAARAEEQAHYAYLTGAGAKPLTTTFTVPDLKIVTDVPTFLKTVVLLEEAFIAAYLAAAQEFAILGQAKLVQDALQIGAIEAEHRAGIRFYAIQAGVLSGTPNDVAFEKGLFGSVGEAAAALQKLGFIGGSGPQITYPGPGAIDNSGLSHLTP